MNNGESFAGGNNSFSQGVLSVSENSSISFNISVQTGADLYKAASICPGPNVNIGASYSFSSSNITKMMTDINGDGLADILEMNPGSNEINVNFNTGNGYTEKRKVKLPEWENINNWDFISQENDATFDLGIINDVPIFKKLNGKFSSAAINPFGIMAETYVNSLDWSSSVTLGLNGGMGANFDYGINIVIPAPPFYIGTVHITGAGGAGANANTTINGTTVKMMDLDGDGLVDHVLKIPNGSIWWKRNLSGKFGLLRKIHLPQGGNIELEYTEMYGTVKNPNFKYVMSKVTVNDGCGGTVPSIEHREHSVVTEYEYKDGYYDRAKKDFYGFGKVTTTFADGSKQEDTYNNDAYYLKGALISSEFKDENGNILSKNTTDYCVAPFALPETEVSKQYEAASEDAFIETRTSYTYDEYGNCTFIDQNFGDGEKLTAEIDYENRDSNGKFIIGLPSNISVYGSNNRILRYREGSYDEIGQLETLKQYFSETGYS